VGVKRETDIFPLDVSTTNASPSDTSPPVLKGLGHPLACNATQNMYHDNEGEGEMFECRRNGKGKRPALKSPGGKSPGGYVHGGMSYTRVKYA